MGGTSSGCLDWNKVGIAEGTWLEHKLVNIFVICDTIGPGMFF